MRKPCIRCGEPTDGTRCDECRPPREPNKVAPRAAGYTSSWDKLSKRARKAQPFCLDCGSRDDLTTDHTPEAWRRFYAGKPIRLCDVAVVCRSCNSKRGRARPDHLGDRPASRGTGALGGGAKGVTHPRGVLVGAVFASSDPLSSLVRGDRAIAAVEVGLLPLAPQHEIAVFADRQIVGIGNCVGRVWHARSFVWSFDCVTHPWSMP